MLNKVSRETIDLFHLYLDLLKQWNKAYNLVAFSTIESAMDRHIIDSFQLKPYLKNSWHIMDVGSGGGLPGLILSYSGFKHITLIESDQLKATFLERAAKISPNQIKIINKRVEKVFLDDVDVITCRAFSSLANIFALTSHLRVKEKYLLLKGKKARLEIDEALEYWQFDFTLSNSATGDGFVVEIFNLKKK